MKDFINAVASFFTARMFDQKEFKYNYKSFLQSQEIVKLFGSVEAVRFCSVLHGMSPLPEIFLM